MNDISFQNLILLNASVPKYNKDKDDEEDGKKGDSPVHFNDIIKGAMKGRE